MSNVSRYVILFQGRAGSTYLTEHLRSHSQIHARFEDLADNINDWNAQLDTMSQLFFGNQFGEQIRAVGFKAKYTDIADIELFRNFVEDNDIKVIHLFRRNLVKLIISIIRADELRRRCGESNLFDRKHELGRIKVKKEDFRRHKRRIRDYRELKEFVDGLNADIFRLHYEQLLYGLDHSLGRLWKFLGVDHQKTNASVYKNTPDRLEDAVENLDELRASFPEYERFFDEDNNDQPVSNRRAVS